MELIILSSKSEPEFLKRLGDAWNNKPTKPKKSIVIDGFTLGFVLENEKIS